MTTPSGAVVASLTDAGALTVTIAGKVMWSVGPFGSAGRPYALSLRPSGDLVLVSNGYSSAVWASGTACKGTGPYTAQVGRAAGAFNISRMHVRAAGGADVPGTSACVPIPGASPYQLHDISSDALHLSAPVVSA